MNRTIAFILLFAFPKLNVSPVSFGDDFYVISFRKADTELCGKIEEALKQIIAGGEDREISDKRFGENLLLNIE